MFVIAKMQRQLGMFMAILIVVSAVIIALIVYTLTMDKMRSIATLKLVGAPDRTIIGSHRPAGAHPRDSRIWPGVAMIAASRTTFPRRVLWSRGTSRSCSSLSSVCLLASLLSIRAAVKVDPAKALAG